MLAEVVGQLVAVRELAQIHAMAQVEELDAYDTAAYAVVEYTLGAELTRGVTGSSLTRM